MEMKIYHFLLFIFAISYWKYWWNDLLNILILCKINTENKYVAENNNKFLFKMTHFIICYEF